jgi:hypothetical protein
MDKIISKEQLLRFAQLVYSAGCHGYMDLLDNFCERAVDDLYEDLKRPPMLNSMVSVSGVLGESPISLVDTDSNSYGFPQYLNTNEMQMLRGVTLTNTTETPEG